MKNLPEPARHDARDDLVTALKKYQYRGKTLGYDATPDEVDGIVALYDQYDAARGAASKAMTAPGMPAALKTSVHDSYRLTQRDRKLKHVRERIFAGVELCPVCGIDPPTELDHFLPRAHYKALAIYVRNLVPLCHLCNHKKFAGFADPGQLGFVHAYFDLLPDVNFLRVGVTLAGPALTVDFGIDADSGLIASLSDRLTNIHKSLQLNARYQAEVNTYLAGQAVALHTVHGQSGAAGVVRHLQAQAHYETKRFYRNHWRPTLLSALAAHDDFCDGGFAVALPVAPEILADVRGV